MIRLIAVGRVKDSYSREGIEDYAARIKKYSKFEIIEVKESSVKEEGNRILGLLKDKLAVVLTIEGKMHSSEEFADFIKKTELDIVFIIGGSEGLAKEVVDKANLQISMSKMTFAHGMCRLFLVEQIYRAFKIIKGETYHK